MYNIYFILSGDYKPEYAVFMSRLVAFSQYVGVMCSRVFLMLYKWDIWTLFLFYLAE